MDFKNHRTTRGTAALEIVSLIDVVFLLLLFFLLTATYVKNPNLDVNLPKAGTSREPDQKTKDISIVIRSDGTMRYENQDVTMEKFEGILRASYAENKDAVIVVQADTDSKHGRVVQVMDIAKKIGFAKLAIATSAPGSSSE